MKKIPRGAGKILEKLNNEGYEAFLVGGCVRDIVMGRIPTDWDITTSATPDELKAVFKKHKLIETGIKHGTVTLLDEGVPFEITTYRVDGAYSDKRRPDHVRFTRSLSEDLRRRDFTINAMAMDIEGKIIDENGGLEDIRNKMVRCVGDPFLRFEEDALRILRAIRFQSQLGFDVDEKTEEAIISKKELLRHISKERIRGEFEKILIGDNVRKVLLRYSEVIAIFIPEIVPAIGFDQCNPFHVYDVYEHSVNAVSIIDKNPKYKMAAFLHDLGKPGCFIMERGWGHFYHHETKGAKIAKDVLRRLKYDNDTIEDNVTISKVHGTVFNSTEKYARHKLNQMGEKRLRFLISLEKADVASQNPKIIAKRIEKIEDFERCVNKVIGENQCFSLRDLKINGEDLIGLGYQRGPLVGKELKHLLTLVIENTIENNKEALLSKAKQDLK